MKTIYQETYRDIIDKLIIARKQAHLTQFQVAECLGKPQSYIAKIENKDRKIDILEFLQLCEVLNISASNLIATFEHS